MDDILRFDGAVRHDPAIAEWFARHTGELGAIAREWFERMRSSGDDVLELFHDGCPVVCVGDVPFAYVNAFTSHVNVGFYRGAELHDPAKMLVGTGRRMRHVKLKPGVALDREALAALIDGAHVRAAADAKR